MNELAIEQLPLFLVLMLPGLVSQKVYDLQVPSTRDDAGRYALDALFFGTVNAGLWFAPALWVLPRAEPGLVPYLLIILALVVSPVLLAVVAVRVLKSDRLRGIAQHPIPMAWDYFFGRGRPCFILCRLKNGKSIGGYFGPGSFASSFPSPRDIYLEQIWNIDADGRLSAPIPDSAGVLISFEECELVEFFDVVHRAVREKVHEQ